MADSPFPFIDGLISDSTGDPNEAVATELPMLYEYAWDFAANDFVLQDGNPIIFEGLEALKVVIFKALRTERYHFLAYSWDYGSELEQMIGGERQFEEAEAERIVTECLSIIPYVLEVYDFQFETESELKVTFTVRSVYGEVDISV